MSVREAILQLCFSASAERKWGKGIVSHAGTIFGKQQRKNLLSLRGAMQDWHSQNFTKG
jgi:hypothetical protein